MKKIASVFFVFFLLSGCGARQSATSSVVGYVEEFHTSEIVQFSPTIASLESIPSGFEWARRLCRNAKMMKKVVIPVSKELASELLSLGQHDSGTIILLATTAPDAACLDMFRDVNQAEEAFEIYNSLLSDRSILKSAAYQWGEKFNQ